VKLLYVFRPSRYFAAAVQFFEHIRGELDRLTAAGLLRTPLRVQGAQGPQLMLADHPALCFCSNNYLGLADAPEIVAAASSAARDYGFGACSSRHISGTMSPHIELERRSAQFVKQPRALFFATGYAANVGTIQALCSPETLVLSDALNHASLIDGCRLGRGAVRVYRHADWEHARDLLRAERHRFAAALLVTESLFSMDGDVAPLAALRTLCDRYDAALVVDEAHALGALGPTGRGMCELAGVRPDVLTATFGKAFGASGAFAAGPADVVQLIENRARSYVYSTAPSPCMPAAALAAIDLVEVADERRERLRTHARDLRMGLRSLGFQVPDGDSHIIPVLLGAASMASQLSAELLARGVFVHGIRPPTVPAGASRLRVTPMATHEPSHIEQCLAVFREVRG
jgi:8-amino-7-oxononanoate synthase